MMKKTILFLLFIPTFVFSQGWEKRIGGNGIDKGYSIQQTTDGGFIISGITGLPDSYARDLYLLKINNVGDTLWTTTIDNGWDDEGYSVKQTYDGGYIITGYISGFIYSNKDVYLVKTDSNGDTLWTKTYGKNSNDYGNSVQQTTDSGYIVTGGTWISGTSDVYLIKTDNNGDTLWTKTYGGSSLDEGIYCQQTTDRGYIITGFTSSYGYGDRNVYLIKTDNNGDTLWTKTFSNDQWNIGSCVQQTSDGGYIVLGYTGGLTNNNDKDVYLIKTDLNGDTLWTKTFGGEYDDYGISIQETIDGGYIVTGQTESYENGDDDVYLLKTNSHGDTLWTKTFGGEYWDSGCSVQQTIDEGYIITGCTDLFGTNCDIYIIKTNENGIITTTTNIPSPNSNRKLVKIIDLSGREISIPKKNQPHIEIYDDGTAIKKMKLQ